MSKSDWLQPLGGLTLFFVRKPKSCWVWCREVYSAVSLSKGISGSVRQYTLSARFLTDHFWYELWFGLFSIFNFVNNQLNRIIHSDEIKIIAANFYNALFIGGSTKSNQSFLMWGPIWPNSDQNKWREHLSFSSQEPFLRTRSPNTGEPHTLVSFISAVLAAGGGKLKEQKSQDDLPSPAVVLSSRSRGSAPNSLHHPPVRRVLQRCCLGKLRQVLALKSNWHAMFSLYQSF